MKKILLTAVAVMFVGVGMSFASNDDYYQNAKEAAKAANDACAVFGQKAVGGSNKDHSGVVRYGSSSTNSTTRQGGQNETRIGGEASGRAVVGKLGVDGSFTHHGARTDKSSSEQSSTAGHLYYKCK